MHSTHNIALCTSTKFNHNRSHLNTGSWSMNLTLPVHYLACTAQILSTSSVIKHRNQVLAHVPIDLALTSKERYSVV